MRPSALRWCAAALVTIAASYGARALAQGYSGAAFWLPAVEPSFQAAPGAYVDTSPNLDKCGSYFAAAGPSAWGSATVNVYVVWLNDVATPWTAAQQNLVIGWINGLAASQWGTVFGAYPVYWVGTGGSGITSYTSFAWEYVTGLRYAGGDLVNESGGTYGNQFCYQGQSCPSGTTGGTCDTGMSAIDGEVTAGRLGSVSPAVYVVLPSSTSTTFSSGCGSVAGQNGQTTSGSRHYAEATRNDAPAGTPNPPFPSPNGDSGFDTLLELISHELGEHLSIVSFSGCSSTQIADPCADNGATYWSNTYAAPNGQLANYQATCPALDAGVPLDAGAASWDAGRCDFVLQDFWYPYEGGFCTQGVPPFSMTRMCKSGADCAFTVDAGGVLGWRGSGRCSQGLPGNQAAPVCAPPSCSDGVLDGYESDVDCGSTCGVTQHYADASAPLTSTCASGKKCRANNDCLSDACDAGVCQ